MSTQIVESSGRVLEITVLPDDASSLVRGIQVTVLSGPGLSDYERCLVLAQVSFEVAHNDAIYWHWRARVLAGRLAFVLGCVVVLIAYMLIRLLP
jgi:hypothetical protein